MPRAAPVRAQGAAELCHDSPPRNGISFYVRGFRGKRRGSLRGGGNGHDEGHIEAAELLEALGGFGQRV